MSVSFNWFGSGSFLYPLPLELMTILLVTAYISELTYLKPDDGNIMLL
jgi:hypothetical protein